MNLQGMKPIIATFLDLGLHLLTRLLVSQFICQKYLLCKRAGTCHHVALVVLPLKDNPGFYRKPISIVFHKFSPTK